MFCFVMCRYCYLLYFLVLSAQGTMSNVPDVLSNEKLVIC